MITFTLPFLILLFPLCTIKFASAITILLLKEFSLTFLVLYCVLTINSSLVYLKKELFCYHFSRMHILEMEFKINRFFSLSALKTLCYGILTCLASDKKSMVGLILVCLYEMFYFFQPDFGISLVWLWYGYYLLIFCRYTSF